MTIVKIGKKTHPWLDHEIRSVANGHILIMKPWNFYINKGIAMNISAKGHSTYDSFSA